MRFELTQRVGAPVDEVAAAFSDPDFYASLDGLPNIAPPEVLDHRADGDVVQLRLRYRFTGELSAAARAALDPARLTWVDESVHDLGTHEVRFRLIADHYADRFTGKGRYRFTPVRGDGGSTERRVDGEIRVKALLVGATVERALVSGLRSHLEQEASVVEGWLAAHG